MKPPNFVRQCLISHRHNGGMFKSEVGVQEVTTSGANRFRAYVTDSWAGGVQCFRDTEEEAVAELPRLWKEMFG